MRRRYLTDEIFGGDTEAFEAMKSASDGFEHGYMDVEDVRGLVEQVLQRSMTAVRRALIGASGVGADAEEILLGDDYAEPRGLVPTLHGLAGQLALKDRSKPRPSDVTSVEIDSSPAPRATKTSEGEVQIELPSTFTAVHLPDNVEFRVSGTFILAAHVKQSGAARVDRVSRAKRPDEDEPQSNDTD